MLIGYARVSTLEQDNELQLRELRRAGVRKVFQEKVSGARMGERVQLQQLLEQLRPGDTVVVWRLDRLARSLRDLLAIADRITGAGAEFRSLTESIDTTTAAGRLAFQMLGAVGEFERGIVRERAIAGLEVARAAGVRAGRPRATDTRADAVMLKRWQSEKYSLGELAKMHGVSVSTVKRRLWSAGADTVDQAALQRAAASAPGRGATIRRRS